MRLTHLVVAGAFLLSSLAFAGSTNQIPDECKAFAEKYLLSPSNYDSDEIGGRLWNLDALRNAPTSSDQELSCKAKVWKQAESDEAEYWAHIANKYGCTANNQLPPKRPDSCPEAKWDLVYRNLSYLHNIDAITTKRLVAAGCNLGSDLLQESTRSLISSVMSINNYIAKDDPREPAISSSAAATITSGAAAAQLDEHFASKLQAAEFKKNCAVLAGGDMSKLKAEYGGHDTDSVAGDIGKCALGAAQGIINNIWDMIKGIGKTIVAPYKLMRKFVEFLFNGSASTFAREELVHPTSVLQKVEDFIKSGIEALETKLANEYKEFSCYNTEAQFQKGCSMATYLGVDILAFVPGFQAFAGSILGKAAELAKLDEAWAAINIGKGAAAAKIAASAAKAGEEVTAIGEETAQALKGAKWVEDASTGGSFVKQGGALYYKDATGKVVEVVDAKLSAKVSKQLDQAAASEVKSAKAQAKATAKAEEAANAPPSTLQKVWDKVSPSQRYIKKVEKYAKKAISDLPGTYVDDSKLTERLEKDIFNDPSTKVRGADGTPSLRYKYIQARDAEAKQSADFLKLEQRTVDAGSGAKDYVLKDPAGKAGDVTFKRVQDDADGSWWYQSKLGPGPTVGKPTFPVYINADAAKMTESLPELFARAGKDGAFEYRLGASSRSLESGKRVAVYFTDAKKAKAFTEEVNMELEKAGIRQGSNTFFGSARRIANLYVIRPYRAAKTGAWFTTKSVLASAATRCAGGGDPKCFCKAMNDGGVNPKTGEPAEVAPFDCNDPAYAKVPEEALAELKAMGIAGPAPASAPSTQEGPPPPPPGTTTCPEGTVLWDECR